MLVGYKRGLEMTRRGETEVDGWMRRRQEERRKRKET
jgi:hypothetical protein